MIHAGVDLHQEFCYVTALDARGKCLKQGRVRNRREDLQKYFHGWPEPVSVAFEACTFWPAFVEAIESEVAHLHMVHPARVKAIASAKLKNDRVDSATLAHLLRCDLLPESWMADGDTRQLRTRTRARVDLGQMRTQLKNRVRALLARHGLHPPMTDVFGKQGRVWLAEQVLPEASRDALDGYLRLLKAFDQEIVQQQRKLERGAKKDERIQWLTTIPGIAPYAASIILAEIGDIERFDRKALFSYAGLVPWVRDSAEKTWRGPITRAGSSRLRWILVEAAVTAVRTRPAIRAWYERWCRKKPAAVARVVLARRLLSAIYAMLRDGACFDESLFATM
jgi:transposase